MNKCPSCGASLEFVGSLGLTLHEGSEYQADRFDCLVCHSTILIIATPEDD